MNISERDYLNYMHLLESAIWDYKMRYNSLQATIDNWNDFFNPTSKTSGLTIEQMKDLQKSYENRQKEYFLKWVELNKPIGGTPNGFTEFYNATKQRELKHLLIGITYDIFDKKAV